MAIAVKHSKWIISLNYHNNPIKLEVHYLHSTDTKIRIEKTKKRLRNLPKVTLHNK